MKILQQQEKLQKMEQQRMEKEIRERLAFEVTSLQVLVQCTLYTSYLSFG